jgi:hypothetical protein
MSRRVYVPQSGADDRFPADPTIRSLRGSLAVTAAVPRTAVFGALQPMGYDAAYG